MKLSEHIAQCQKELAAKGDLEVMMGTFNGDGTAFVFYEEPGAMGCQIPEDDGSYRSVFLIAWQEVFQHVPKPPQPPGPTLRRVK